MAITAPFDIGQFIVIDPVWHDGWPYIRGTRKTVASVAVLHGEGFTPEEIAEEKFLELPQVYAALCYYAANKAEMDAVIDAYDAETLRMAAAARQ
jgi:uncharacterized protein (DUF433 family)